jgi:uncharacterized membrane protein
VKSTTRVEAFSDGVLAIAITLLVLDLRVPVRETLERDGVSLATALGHEWPAFAAYVTSFLVIGIIWINHHNVFALIGRVDRGLLFLNLLLLMFVGTIPFTTALLSEYLTAGRDAHTAAALYSGAMLGMGLAFGLLYARAARNPRLLAAGVDPVAARASVPRFTLGSAVYAVTVAVGLVNAVACLILHFLLALYYAFAQTMPAALRRESGLDEE